MIHGWSEETQRVVAAIPNGKCNAISRAALAAALGVPDRKMRKMIEQARNEGALILNRSDGRGYYRSDDLDEIQAQYCADRARALNTLRRLKTMRRLLRNAGFDVK